MERKNIKYINFCEKVMDTLGRGYTENIYHECLCALLRKNNINYSKEVVIPIEKFDSIIGYVKADIIIDNLIIECKAINELQENYLPQIINYMELLKIYNGIFVNFVQNPSKSALQLYTVERNNFEYVFKNHYTEEEIIFDNKGTKVVDDERFNKWIKDNIIVCPGEMLSKDNVQQFSNFNKSDLKIIYKHIEQFTKIEFKDKQIDNKKYKQIIQDYKIDNYFLQNFYPMNHELLQHLRDNGIWTSAPNPSKQLMRVSGILPKKEFFNKINKELVQYIEYTQSEMPVRERRDD